MMTAEPKQPRVSRLSIGRLCNLGNYEHIRYEVTVEIPEGADAAKTLIHVETALNTMAQRPPDPYTVSQARAYLAKPVEELPAHVRENLDQCKEIVHRADNWKELQERARLMLSDFNLSCEYKDHKAGWDDEA